MDIKQLSGRDLSNALTQDKNGVQLETNKPTSGAENTTKPLRKDSVEISSQAHKINQAVAALNKVPEVNAARVSELRTAIQNGSFNVDSQSTAEKLLSLEATFNK